MGTWSIEPSDASIDQNGNAYFPSNSSPSEKVYTITYTSDDGTTCEKRVIQEGTGCLFGYNANSSNIPGDRESVYIFGTITPTSTDVSEIIIDVYEGSEFINGSLRINSSNELVGTVKKNDTQEARIIRYRLKTSNVSVCYDETATQSSVECNCDTETVNLSWNWDESDVKTVTVSVEECVEGLSYNQVDDYIITNNGNVLSINPNGINEGTQNRDGIITVQYNTGSKSCSKTINVTQGTIGYTCSDIEFSDYKETRFPLEEDVIKHTYCTLYGPIGVTSEEEFERIVTVTIDSRSGVNVFLEDYFVEDNRVKCSVKFTLEEVNEGGNFDVYANISGSQNCKIGSILRTCPCANDNCNCVNEGIDFIQYIHSRNEDGSVYEDGSYVEAIQSDSIMIEHGLDISHLYYDSDYTQKIISNYIVDYQDDDPTGVKNYPIGAWKAKIDGWLNVYIVGNGTDYNSMLYYVADVNDGDGREAEFTYYVEGSQVICGELAEKEHSAWLNHKSCSIVHVTIKQAKKDTYWAHTGIEDEYGRELREERGIPKE